VQRAAKLSCLKLAAIEAHRMIYTKQRGQDSTLASQYGYLKEGLTVQSQNSSMGKILIVGI